ncbi:unnamed protein product [Bursaphelenchus okinawaensis]|uniref:alcohol dehydrogenase n=1 Tax=Bursaphelenchus okinawaensis TaxID=465554 RepID=A0A811L8H6_9BILA|nr:unnamed protein product [Bursaphelenchus okinawaensis]CAG9119411.1 unnamed protein product [Bursaphelenchus okinawaensis]
MTTYEIPKMQKAAVFDEHNGKLDIRDIPVPELGPDDILVKITYSGVCHTDLHVWLGDFPLQTKKPPLVGGHEGAGIVVKLGSNVSNFKLGDRAGVKWINSSCLCCEQCKMGHEPNCEKLVLSGFHRDGSFQQYAAVKGTEAAPIPDNVDMALVAPILCAGLTAYKALKESNVKPGETVVITGAGGGLGTLAIQYAKAMGMRVLAIENGAKEDHCRAMGADMFLDPYKTSDVPAAVQLLTEGGPHGMCNFAPTTRTIEDAIKYIRSHGTVVMVALPRDSKVTFESFFAIIRTITIKGSHVGTRKDMDEALQFFARGQVRIPCEVVPLKDLPKVYERMQNNQINGRVVLDLWK